MRDDILPGTQVARRTCLQLRFRGRGSKEIGSGIGTCEERAVVGDLIDFKKHILLN